MVVVPILAHNCLVRTFSCLSRERTVHNTIMLIPTVFLPYTLLSNCYLVTFFSFRIIHEKFKLTSHADSHSFTNVTCTLSTWLRTCLIVILLLSRKNRAQMKISHSSFHQQELARISNFLHLSTFCSTFGTVRLGH